MCNLNGRKKSTIKHLFSKLSNCKSTCGCGCNYKVRSSNYNCCHSKLVNWANLLSPVIQFPPWSPNLVGIKGLHLIQYSLRHSSNLMKYSSSQSSLHSAFIKGHVAVYVTMRSEIFAGNLKFVAKIRNPIIQLPCHSKLVHGAKFLVHWSFQEKKYQLSQCK